MDDVQDDEYGCSSVAVIWISMSDCTNVAMIWISWSDVGSRKRQEQVFEAQMSQVQEAHE